MGRTLSLLCYGLALLAFVAGVVMLLQQWVNWLQSETWRPLSMLRLMYDLNMLTTQWYVYPGNTRIVHDFLAWLPATGGLIAISPLLWGLGARLRP